jgi:electron transport complex protein RnfG
MSAPSRYGPSVVAAVLLAAFAAVGSGLVAITFNATEERIAANERARLLQSVDQILPPERYDNDLFTDTIEVAETPQLGVDEPITVYRARKDGKPVAAVFTTVAPDGYNGAIKLLIGVYADGTLAGVRVLSHRETPGLGDAIEIERSDWLTDFAGKSLRNPRSQRWKVRKDGGVFDQFTGATITPRAVVEEVHNALLFFRDHKAELFRVDPVQEDG